MTQNTEVRQKDWLQIEFRRAEERLATVPPYARAIWNRKGTGHGEPK